MTPRLLASVIIVAAALTVDGNAALGQPDTSWTISSTPAVTIGKVEGKPQYLFSSIGVARLLPDQRIVVTDTDKKSIRVFGPDGEFQATMGQPGEGPGEFLRIFGLWTVPPDTIRTWDYRNARITTYKPDGTLVATQRIYPNPSEAPNGLLDLAAGPLNGGDVSLAWTVGNSAPSVRSFRADQTVFGRFGPEGHLKRILGTVTGIVRSQGSPVVFSPFIYADTYRDSVFVTNGMNPEIIVLSPEGGVARTITLPASSLDGSVAWRALNDTLTARRDSSLLRQVQSRPRAEEAPALGGMFVDYQGYIWAKIYDPKSDILYYMNTQPWGGGGEWIVSRPDGNVVSRVRMPDGVVPLDVRGERLLGLTRDPLGVERLVVHTIQR